jgi:hypothetical protein
MPMSDDPPIPLLRADPKNRAELKDWLEDRARHFPGEPLSAREYLMVQRLQGRKAYSEM